MKKNMLLVLLTFVLGVVGFNQLASADTMPDTTNITVHKLQYSGANQDGKLPNDGLEKDKIPDGFESYNPTINGAVEFTLVDVTAYVAKNGAEETQNELTTLKSDDYADWISTNGEVVAKKEVDENGLVTFEYVDSKLVNDSYRYYVILETETPEKVKSPAQPVLVQLPMTNSEGTGFLETVFVYPKNQIGDKPDAEKQVVDGDGSVIETPSYSVGDEVHYLVDLTVPSDIEDYVAFQYADAGQKGLTYTGNDTQKQTLTGITTAAEAEAVTLEEGTDYLYTKDANGFTINFIVKDGKVSEKVASLGGGNIYLNYSMTLNEEAITDSPIDNDFLLSWQNSPSGGKGEKPGQTPVYTGGMKFLKKDGKDSSRLTGAQFVIRNSEGNYYQGVKDGAVVWGDKATANQFTTDDRGEFEITGLAYGTYYIEETKAPDGYALNTKEIEFEVKKDSYTGKELEINNYKKSILPNTGSAQLIGIVLVGFALVFCGGLYYKKR